MDEFTPSERNIIVRFLHWLLRLFGWTPPEPDVPDLPEEPDMPDEPDDPEEPDPEEPDEPEPLHPVVVRVADLRLVDAPGVVDGPWTLTSGALLARHPGDGELTATAMVEHGDATYSLWARVWAQDSRSDAFYGGFAGHAIYRCYPREHGRFVWVNCGTWSLSEGASRVGVGTGEVGLRLDCLVLDPNGLTPQQLDELVGAPPHVEPPIEPEPEPEPEPPTPEPEPEPEPPVTPPGGRGWTYQADPTFTRDRLNSKARAAYGALWAAINKRSADGWAKSCDTYRIGRSLGDHIQHGLLIPLRATGDLKLLDEVVRLMNLVKGTLRRTWRVGTADTNHRRLLWEYSSSTSYQGNDLHAMDGIKAHGLIASCAVAMHVNRHLASPAGHDYGTESDFWTDYLVNDYEAIWRIRKKKPTGFPFNARPAFHAYNTNIKLHRSLGILTGDQAYTREAERMAAVVWGKQVKTASTPSGPAFVWSQGTTGDGADASQGFLNTFTYARYVFADAVEFALDGFDRWSVETLPTFARTISEFILPGYERDIGGGVSKAGLPASDPSEWSQGDKNKYEISGYMLLAPWDARVATHAGQFSDRYVHAPAARLITALWGS